MSNVVAVGEVDNFLALTAGDEPRWGTNVPDQMQLRKLICVARKFEV
jgi:hypothetical protein